MAEQLDTLPCSIGDHIMKNLLWTATVTLVGLAGGFAQAAEWGDLKLKFVMDGKAVALPPLAVTKDVAVCGKMPMPDEAMVAGANGELANVLVYLVPEKGAKVEVHADYDKDKAAKVVLDNKGCRFFPHVATIRKSIFLLIRQ
jgi:hypothetical protein